MKLISAKSSEVLRNFILTHKKKVIESEMFYDASLEEPSELEDKRRLYLLGLALQEFGDELFVVYFPDKLKNLGFPKIWETEMKNQCINAGKDDIIQLDDKIPEYYIFDKKADKFVFVDAEGNISLTRY